MKLRIGAVLSSLALAAAALLAPSLAAADGALGHPTTRTSVGTFGGIAYVQYDGIFEGQTSTGAYRVPYRISAPENFEPRKPDRRRRATSRRHRALARSSVYLRRDFLFSRGFVHAGIGWSTVGTRILDPSVPGTFIEGGFRQFGGNTDDEIIVDFARALAVDPNAAGDGRSSATAVHDRLLRIPPILSSAWSRRGVRRTCSTSRCPS